MTNTTDAKLKLVEAKIKDAEFRIAMLTKLEVAYIIDQDRREASSIQCECYGYWLKLNELIEQRNKLICPNSDHTN